jgi:hypothetical protein
MVLLLDGRAKIEGCKCAKVLCFDWNAGTNLQVFMNSRPDGGIEEQDTVFPLGNGPWRRGLERDRVLY